MRNKIRQAANYIRQADALLITAGAGMGIDSGLPDFRGEEGFWRAFPPLKKLGLNFQSIATPQLFQDNTALAWGFYGLRLNSYRTTPPHNGYYLLKKWADRTTHGAYVFTSNVDDHFQAAGFPDQNVITCHGTIHQLQCSIPCHDETWSAEHFHPQVDDSTCSLTNDHPTCPECGAIARPNILMFKDFEWLDHPHYQKEAQLKKTWLPKVQNLVIIELGAGKAIPTVRNFSNHIASQHSAPLIRINPDEAGVSQRHHISLKMGALAALQAIENYLIEHPI